MMLSTISHSMPPVYAPSPAPPPAMTASLPIIPPRPSVSQQRPKLSVNTAQPRSFGKGASLRLDTLSAVSPTRINTFSNAYPALDRHRPSKPRLSINSNLTNNNSNNPASAATTPSSASTLSSALTSSSSSSSSCSSTSLPYKQPHNVVSILTNGPARSLLPRKMAAARPMFPAEKRVSFRTPLEEEITTIKYTLAHSDLDSSISTISSSLTSSASAATSQSSPSTHHALSSDASKDAFPAAAPSSAKTTSAAFSSLQDSHRPTSPRVGEKRDSSSSEDDSDSCPATPVAGRRKRSRDWRWTLGPLPGSESSTASESHSSQDSS